MRALLGRLVGLCLVVLVLFTVPWKDRVVGTDGREVRGRIVGGSGGEILLRTERGEERIAVRNAAAAQEGLLTTAAHLADRPRWALLGVAVHLAALLATMLRWGLFLSAAGIPMPVRSVLRFGWIGQFFAAFLPGGVAGGDVMKAVYVARAHPERRAHAVLTVLADRATALFALCCIAAGALLAHPQAARLGPARTVLLVLPVLGAVALALLFLPGLRVRTRLPRLLDRLPFQRILRELREAGALYGQRPGPLRMATLAAFACHALVLAAFYCYGRALGLSLPAVAVAAAIPIAQMLTSLPGLPGGWGVGDAAFLFLLPPAGVAAGPAVALSFTYRILHTLLALPGGLVLARRGGPDPVPRNGETASCPSS